jgi:hypothetical protein
VPPDQVPRAADPSVSAGNSCNNRHKARVDDALIRRDQSQSPYTRCTHNRPIGRIPKRPTDCRDLCRHIHRERYYLKNRIRVELAKKVIERDLASGAAFAKQNRNLEQCDGADRNGLMPADSIPQNARLLPRKFPGRCQPANRYMCVEQ